MIGGCRWGTERKLCDLAKEAWARLVGTAGDAGSASGRATRKENLSRLLPGSPDAVPASGELSPAVTVTAHPR